MIRVLLAADQLMFRTAVRRLLELERDIAVVAEVGRGDELVAAALAAQPDVAVVDIELPGQDGISAAVELRRVLPTCRALILTMYGRPGFVQRAMAGGVSGFVLKDAPVEALAAAIRRCAAGEDVVDASLAAQAFPCWPVSTFRHGAGDPRCLCRRPPHGRDRAAPVAVRGHGPQQGVGDPREAGRPQPHRGRTGCQAERLALTHQGRPARSTRVPDAARAL